MITWVWQSLFVNKKNVVFHSSFGSKASSASLTNKRSLLFMYHSGVSIQSAWRGSFVPTFITNIRPVIFMHRIDVADQGGLLPSSIITLVTGKWFDLLMHHFFVDIQGFKGLKFFATTFTHEDFVSFMFLGSMSGQASSGLEPGIAKHASEGIAVFIIMIDGNMFLKSNFGRSSKKAFGTYHGA